MIQTAFKILLVEDDPNMREMLSHILLIDGYDVLLAGDGREALGVLEQERDIDLVISDFRMPTMNGADLNLTMQEREITCPFILCTGSPELIPTDVLPRLNLHALITKPYPTAIIEQHVSALVAKKSQDETSFEAMTNSKKETR